HVLLLTSFFFIMLRPPPPSTLFPYTTLFRSASAVVLKPQSQLAAYTAAKSAVAGLTRALANELRDDGIRVNAVAPGMMKTADNLDRKSTRLNSSHVAISYAVFCLKKKTLKNK